MHFVKNKWRSKTHPFSDFGNVCTIRELLPSFFGAATLWLIFVHLLRVFHPRDDFLRRSPLLQLCPCQNPYQELFESPGLMDGLGKNALFPGKNLERMLCAQECTKVRMPCTPWEKFRIKLLVFWVLWIPLQKCSRNPTVDSKPSVSH